MDIQRQRIADSRLNPQAIALEEAETEIRITAKRDYLARRPKAETDRKILAIISKYLRAVRIDILRRAAFVSLIDFYKRQYAELRRISTPTVVILAALYAMRDKSETTRNTAIQTLKSNGVTITEANGKIYASDYRTAGGQNLGVPLRKYTEDYIREKITPTMNKLSGQFAMDPDDVSGRNSLRNRAEMEIRYDDHQRTIEDLQKSGAKLVIASAHADCSDRCRPWQGRVYSLDGTSGTTEDGRKYVPLEEATNVPYTTKAGITYMNGLLGFNCRHYLVEYKPGTKFPQQTADQEKAQYEITQKQRYLERTVRKWKIETIEAESAEYRRYARQKAIEWNEAYVNFSRLNHRAYLPGRVRLV